MLFVLNQWSQLIALKQQADPSDCCAGAAVLLIDDPISGHCSLLCHIQQSAQQLAVVVAPPAAGASHGCGPQASVVWPLFCTHSYSGLSWNTQAHGVMPGSTGLCRLPYIKHCRPLCREYHYSDVHEVFCCSCCCCSWYLPCPNFSKQHVSGKVTNCVLAPPLKEHLDTQSSLQCTSSATIISCNLKMYTVEHNNSEILARISWLSCYTAHVCNHYIPSLAFSACLSCVLSGCV